MDESADLPEPQATDAEAPADPAPQVTEEPAEATPHAGVDAAEASAETPAETPEASAAPAEAPTDPAEEPPAPAEAPATPAEASAQPAGESEAPAESEPTAEPTATAEPEAPAESAVPTEAAQVHAPAPETATESTEPTATEPTATEPAASEATAAESPATEPATAEAPTAEPASAEPASAEPASTEPTSAEPAGAEPAGAEPAAAEAAPHPVPHPPAGTPASTPGAAPAASGPPSWDWGRVADDGTVFLRTPEGERAIGQWHAGDINEGLAYYQRRYEDLVAEVSLLENRLATRTGDARAVRTNATHLKESLATATVIGDVEALRQRLDAVLAGAQERIDAEKAARSARAEQAAAAKRALAEEAEQLAQSTDWKVTGDRFRTLVDDWKAITGVDRKTDQELWTRVSAARSEFGRRRGAHFAQLDTERKAVQQRKEKLCEEAESLSDSSEWGPTAARYKQLMTEWKAAGRAAKPVDDALWARFRAAQDKFFTRRNAVNAERDQQFRQNQQLKEQILAEAEALDPASPGAQRKLREIQSRYDKAGKVPREAMGSLDRRMTAVEQKFRGAADSRFRKGPDPSSSPLVIRLRESVDKLERRLERARADGRDSDAAEAEAALATQREWLAQAERAR